MIILEAPWALARVGDASFDALPLLMEKNMGCAGSIRRLEHEDGRVRGGLNSCLEVGGKGDKISARQMRVPDPFLTIAHTF